MIVTIIPPQAKMKQNAKIINCLLAPQQIFLLILANVWNGTKEAYVCARPKVSMQMSDVAPVSYAQMGLRAVKKGINIHAGLMMDQAAYRRKKAANAPSPSIPSWFWLIVKQTVPIVKHVLIHASLTGRANVLTQMF
jgi:hypothetical protein